MSSSLIILLLLSESWDYSIDNHHTQFYEVLKIVLHFIPKVYVEIVSKKPNMVPHAFSHSTWETEASWISEFKANLIYIEFQDNHCLHRETLSQKTKREDI